MSSLACTVEQLSQLQQLQITLWHQQQQTIVHATNTAACQSAGPSLPSTVPVAASIGALEPQLSINNDYPFKPLLRIRDARAGTSSAASSSSAANTATRVANDNIITIPLSVRVDLKDARQRVTHMRDTTVITLHYKQGA